MDHLAINSTTAVADEVKVNPALPATAVVEFMAKWLNLYQRTVCQIRGRQTSQDSEPPFDLASTRLVKTFRKISQL